MLTNRQKSLLLYIVASPFFLAIPLSLITIIFLPFPISKYAIEEISKEIANKIDSKVTFYDLNNDGEDERVIAFHNNAKGEAAIKVMTNQGDNYDAWNFHGYFQKSTENFFCADINNDGFVEINLFYYRNDSVFLASIQPYPNKQILFEEKHITTIWKRDNKVDFVTTCFTIADLNGDGNSELLFLFNAGYSRQPRGIFAYDFIADTMIKSESYGAYLSNMVITDMDDNGFPEIYCGSSTLCNIPDTLGIPYGDYDSWFFYLNNKLELEFSPILNTSAPSSTQISKFVSDEGEQYIVVSFIMDEENKQIIKFFNSSFEVVSEYEMVNSSSSKSKMIIMNRSIILDDKNYLMVGIVDDELFLLNEKIEVIKKSLDQGIRCNIFEADFNKDGKNEHVFMNSDIDFIICDASLEHPAIISTNIQPLSYSWMNYGIKHNGSESDEMYIKTDSNLYFYSYKEDPFYYFKYPLWLLIYFVVVVILWLAQKLQKIQVQRKQKIEDTINNLQMKTIKSRMDPHFMFNVLNGLAHNVAKGNNDEAHNQILRFSQLLRSLMKRVDRLDISLTDEINFVRSYLELEKFRFKDDFEFNIDIEEEVYLTQRVPRMLIQLLVENSIKHGLRNKVGNKKLKIEVVKSNYTTKIIIEDNGIGRIAAKKYSKDSGNGLRIINDMIRLNRKLGGGEISVNYIDLYDAFDKATGTRAEIVF